MELRLHPFRFWAVWRGGSYETNDWVHICGDYAGGADDAAKSAWSPAEYSESGAEYSGRAARTFTGSEHAGVAEFSIAGSE